MQTELPGNERELWFGLAEGKGSCLRETRLAVQVSGRVLLILMCWKCPRKWDAFGRTEIGEVRG